MSSKLEQTIKDLGIIMDARFVPQSRSRNKNESHPSLNWEVSLGIKADYAGNQRWFLQDLEYMQGIGHMPALNKRTTKKLDKYEQRLREECAAERGMYGGYFSDGSSSIATGKKISPPSVGEVLECLLLDSDVLEYSSFEEWAVSYGYAEDSRAAEKIYKACLETALKLRAGLGQKSIAKLREAQREDEEN